MFIDILYLLKEVRALVAFKFVGFKDAVSFLLHLTDLKIVFLDFHGISRLW